MALKAGAERVLVRSGMPAIKRWTLRGDVLILAYHNVLPDGERPAGDISLHLSRADFAAQLDTLGDTHDIVSLRTALSIGPEPRRRPLAVITFDDAYRGAMSAGVAELRARELPATVFVAPSYVGGRAFWWDSIAWPVGTAEGRSFRARALDQAAGDEERVYALASRLGLSTRDVPSHARCASLPELRAAASYERLTFAAHSWSHPNLAAVERDRLERELVAPLAWLRLNLPRVEAYLSYPYGRWSPTVARAATRAGYLAALRVDGGWVKRHTSEALPRFNVPAGITRDGFALRAAGLFCG